MLFASSFSCLNQSSTSFSTLSIICCDIWTSWAWSVPSSPDNVDKTGVHHEMNYHNGVRGIDACESAFWMLKIAMHSLRLFYQSYIFTIVLIEHTCTSYFQLFSVLIYRLPRRFWKMRSRHANDLASTECHLLGQPGKWKWVNLELIHTETSVKCLRWTQISICEITYAPFK